MALSSWNLPVSWRKKKNGLMEYSGHLDNSGNQLNSFFGQIMLLNQGLTNPAHSIAPQAYTVGARHDKCIKFIWIHQTTSPLLQSFLYAPYQIEPFGSLISGFLRLHSCLVTIPEFPWHYACGLISWLNITLSSTAVPVMWFHQTFNWSPVMIIEDVFLPTFLPWRQWFPIPHPVFNNALDNS